MKRNILLACWLMSGGLVLAVMADVAESRKALEAAKISFDEAAATAEKETPGGRIVEIELDWEKGSAYYEVDLLVGDEWKELHIDAVSGKVVKLEIDRPDDAGDRRDVANSRKALDEAKQTFAQAREAVTKDASDARILKVDLELRGGKPVYEVDTLQGDKIVKYYVDGVSGEAKRR